MDFSNCILGIIIAYLLGSIPSSVLIGRIFYKKDVRKFGSKSSGATNTFRVLGVKAGIPVLLIDVLKGYLACNIVFLFGKIPFTIELIPETSDCIQYQLLFGIASVFGHVFPIFAGFKGGKGVATITGIVLAIAPIPTLLAMSVFVVTLLLSRYVSLSSIFAGISFPIIILLSHSLPMAFQIFSILVAITLLLTHRKNIERLIHRQENKANLFKKRKH